MGYLLIADDDIELCRLLEDYLPTEEFTLDWVHDGKSALNQAMSGQYDLLILDIMLPKINGLDVLRQIRSESTLLPVMMLTARGDEIDRVVGLELGADDYLPKPFSPRELLARIRSILRRSLHLQKSDHSQKNDQEQALNHSRILQVGDLSLDAGRRIVMCAEREIEVTGAEFSILQVLLQAAGAIVDRNILSQKALFRRITAFDRSVDMHVSNVRKKLGKHADGRHRIKTVRGAGYQLLASATHL